MGNIHKAIQKLFPRYWVGSNDEPIKDSIHCHDRMIEGVLVRLRFCSPSHKGDTSGVLFYPVTPAQKQELEDIEKRYKEEQIRRANIIKEVQEAQLELDRRRYSYM